MADGRRSYPILLELPTPTVRAYPSDTVIIEKFQAMVALGILNGRIKDYQDLRAILHALDIGADDLDAAITATFARCQSAIPTVRPPELATEMIIYEGKLVDHRRVGCSIVKVATLVCHRHAELDDQHGRTKECPLFDIEPTSAVVKGFGWRPIAMVRLGVRPASESLQGEETAGLLASRYQRDRPMGI